MLQIKKHKLDYDEGIKNRLDFICKYVNVKPKYIQGNLINIKDVTHDCFVGKKKKEVINEIIAFLRKHPKNINKEIDN